MSPNRIISALCLSLLACDPGVVGELERVSVPPLDPQHVDEEVQALTTLASMAVARSQHSATKLPSGKVIVIGGNETVLPSVELFDSATSSWSAAAPLATNRRAHTTTLLNDGTLLVVGGVGASSVLASCERYTPSTNTWAACAAFPRTSYGHTATLLNDGRVLVVGGVGYTNTTYFYDPTANSWTAGPPLAAGRMRHAAVRLNNGAVLISGGMISSGWTASTEILWPNSSAWQSAGTMRNPRNGHSMVVVNGWKNGLVLVAGGGGPNTHNKWEMYNVINGWGTVMGTEYTLGGHSSGTLIALADGTVLLVGDAYGNLNIERMPSNSYTWEVSDTLPQTRNDVPMVELADGKVLLPGGELTVVNGTNSKHASVLVTNAVPAAAFDSALKAPACRYQQSVCAATTSGRASVGPEANAPLTLNNSCADGTAGYFHSDESIDSIRIRSVDGTAITVGKPVIAEVDVWAYAGYTTDKLDLFITSNIATPAWSLVATLTPNKAGASRLSATFTMPSTLTFNYALRAQFRWMGTATPCTTGPYDDRDDLVFAVRWP